MPGLQAEHGPAAAELMIQHRCPNCGTSTHPIKLLVAVAEAPAGRIPYTEPDAEPSFWTGRHTVRGSIRAEVCPNCDLVSWFAETHKDSLPLPGAPPEADEGSLPIPAETPVEE